MGHSRASKAATHTRLVQAAAARFKEHGVDGIGVADLMKELDLTHGGFYKHFASRDELVTEALDLALTESGQAMRDRLGGAGKPDLVGFVNFYLGDEHRNHRAEGCAVAALAGDAARKGAEVQSQFREQIERNLDALSRAVGTNSSAGEFRAEAIFVLSALYGALTMARAVGDTPLSREVLRTVRKRLLTEAATRPAASGTGAISVTGGGTKGGSRKRKVAANA